MKRTQRILSHVQEGMDRQPYFDLIPCIIYINRCPGVLGLPWKQTQFRKERLFLPVTCPGSKCGEQRAHLHFVR